VLRYSLGMRLGVPDGTSDGEVVCLTVDTTAGFSERIKLA
jgi:hypothetical protein